MFKLIIDEEITLESIKKSQERCKKFLRNNTIFFRCSKYKIVLKQQKCYLPSSNVKALFKCLVVGD